jgi:hypothetical protein
MFLVVRRTQRMPLIVRRLSATAGPRSPRSGSNGLRIRLSASVRSPRLKPWNHSPMKKPSTRPSLFGSKTLVGTRSIGLKHELVSPGQYQAEIGGYLGNVSFTVMLGFRQGNSFGKAASLLDRHLCVLEHGLDLVGDALPAPADIISFVDQIVRGNAPGVLEKGLYLHLKTDQTCRVSRFRSHSSCAPPTCKQRNPLPFVDHGHGQVFASRAASSASCSAISWA